MKRPVIYVFANKGLGMTPGKLAAQVAHAVVLSCASEDESRLQLWRTFQHRTMIVLQARDEDHIRNIQDYLKERGFNTFMQIDEGINEIEAHTITALASEILDKEKESVELAFSTFELYKETINLKLEINR